MAMYRIKEIQEKLLHLVGWEQAYDPAKSIHQDLTETESGLYFQGAHPLVTLDNIRAMMPDDYDYKYKDWNMLLNYPVGAKVKHEDLIWIAQQANTNQEPTASDFSEDFNPDYSTNVWIKYNYLSDYLTDLTNKGIASMVQTFIQNKQLKYETKSILENRVIFDGSGRLSNTIRNESKLCGYRIDSSRGMGVTTKIERIGLQMKDATGDVKIYLFHSSKVEPVKTATFNIASNKGSFIWFKVTDWYLPYISDGNNAGGSWYICYNQDALPLNMEAINVGKDFNADACNTCNPVAGQTWGEITKYVSIMPFKYPTPQDFETSPELWDIENNMYTSGVNYGINLEVSIGCDLTDFIINQKSLFQTVLQRETAYIALRTLAMNPAVNVNRNLANATRLDILYELDGSPERKVPNGLGYQLQQAYTALSLDTKGLDNKCLKCQSSGINYGTV